MKVRPQLYKTLSKLLILSTWKDIRHKFTFLWMVYGLIQSKESNIPEWIPFVSTKAEQAQSTERRFSRWLYNDNIETANIYDPVIKKALFGWGEETLYIALDTSMLWNKFCQIRICIIYRGRSIPLVWQTIEHGSSSVKFSYYKELLLRAKSLLPEKTRVVFSADRGFIDTNLMDFLSNELGWNWRIRYKESINIYRRSKRGNKFCHVKMTAQYGHARFYHNVYLTENHHGKVHLAFARHTGKTETWLIASNEPTDRETFTEYGLRFDIEEGFKDDKSGAFNLESSKIRNAKALTRFYTVIAIAKLFLISQGVEVVTKGLRRRVDPHWKRGLSYLKIGFRYLASVESKGYKLLKEIILPSSPDPEPVLSSKGKLSSSARIANFKIKTEKFI
ncbi:MAG: transposase [Methylococcaceae bacterium]|nr:transposase [Methylococcaceae bacterium]